MKTRNFTLMVMQPAQLAKYLILAVGLLMLCLSPVKAELTLKQVGQYGSGAYDKVKIFGNYLYTVTCAGVDILDIRTPASPILVGTFQGPGCAKDVAVSGNYN